jgi:HD-like signal output (HDOD) protein
MNHSLKQKIEETIDFLPPMPASAEDLIRALNSDDADLRTISNIIAKDPSMTINVLKIANSSFYGLPQKVAGVDHAVRLLGISEVASLCLSCAATRSLRPPRGVKAVDLDLFWSHSVATGVFGRILSRSLGIGVRENLYLSGLMHDVGALVLDRCGHDVYETILRLTRQENISVREAEERIVGASHDVVGGWLMEKWKLPELYAAVTRFHHSVTEAPEKHRTYVALISLADEIARLKEHGFGGDMNGVIISEMDAFKILEQKNPRIADLDVVKFIWDLDSVNDEIEEMERMLAVS